MIDEIIDQQLATGIFSHVYCCGGSFVDDRTSYCYRHLPKNQQVFDLASLTKPLVTLPLIIDRYLDGNLEVDWTLGRWLEGSSLALDTRLLELSIAELVSHQTGLVAWHNFWLPTLNDRSLTRAELLTRLNRCATKIRHDKGYLYSDINYILLGVALAETTGLSIAELFNNFLEKLNFSAKIFCGFAPIDKAIPTAYCQIRRRWLRGEVHDENCAVMGGAAGHAGLFSAGDDLVTYLRRLFTSKVGDEIIRRNTQQRFGLMQENYTGSVVFGHLGFTGCAFWLDFACGNYALLLTNRTINSRRVASFPETRRKIFTEILNKICED